MTGTRERLARASHLAYYGEPFDKESQPEKDDWRRMVDAILRELMEPSAGMLMAGQFAWERQGCYGGAWDEHHAKVLQAMLQHILDEPQQEDDEA